VVNVGSDDALPLTAVADAMLPACPASGAATARSGGPEPIVVYRHRLAPRSETGFLGRFYAGFQQLSPIWLGYHLDAGAADLPGDKLRLGRAGPLGAFDRTLFRHFGAVPPVPDFSAQRPRLIHAHFGPGGAFALPLARALGIPLVVTFHGGDATKETHYRRIPLRAYQRRLAALQREAALFVCVSAFIRDILLARGFPGEKLVVIHQGIEILPAPPPSPAEEPYVLFVGRFVEKKGVAHLIDAMRRLGGDAPRLVLVGDGPLAAELRRRAEGLPRVEFLGWQSAAAVRRRMRGAVAVCVPSVTARSGDTEGLPSVAIEAMAEGAPVVATRHAGLPEAIEHERTGLLVPEGDPQALAAALAAVIGRPDFRRRLGEAARAAAIERFDVIRQSRALEAALLRVIAEAACAR
jgi:glycosyltransferase involved in cell wall biosynthesis